MRSEPADVQGGGHVLMNCICRRLSIYACRNFVLNEKMQLFEHKEIRIKKTIRRVLHFFV